MLKLPLILFFLAIIPLVGHAETVVAADDAAMSSEAMMQHFSSDVEESPERKIEEKRKHEILFLMGVALLILLFLTGGMGIAMVAFDKDVFVPHMIFAGLSLTLALVHAATSIAWFWPF